MIAIADNTIDGPDYYERGFEHFQIGPRVKMEYPGKIHNGGANVLFCDGHVTWYPQPELIGKWVDPTKWMMWNTDHTGFSD